jgi:hypothetical protein
MQTDQHNLLETLSLEMLPLKARQHRNRKKAIALLEMGTDPHVSKANQTTRIKDQKNDENSFLFKFDNPSYVMRR